eukprot:281293-Prymnesium_polylepis.1
MTALALGAALGVLANWHCDYLAGARRDQASRRSRAAGTRHAPMADRPPLASASSGCHPLFVTAPRHNHQEMPHLVVRGRCRQSHLMQMDNRPTGLPRSPQRAP